MSYRIGIDVGGTFTDFLVVDEGGASAVFKTPTTPQPATGVFSGLKRIAEARRLSLSDFLGQVDMVVHGTTIATNAVLTGSGARTGFVTTKGFRDILNMRRGLKERQYDAKYSPPPPLVPRYLIQPVEERVDVSGRELVPLNKAEARAALETFRREGVESVAVSFLWSFLSSAHEEEVRELCQEILPDVYVSLSSEVLPQIRVYERHSTTALNAYVGPILARYLTDLQAGMRESGFGGTLLIMQSNAGVMAPEVASRFASNTLLSGPAAGPVAGLFYAKPYGFDNIITIDMGGTSFDVCLVHEGRPTITVEGEVGGYRIASPIVNIHTIGAGGGSIAWIDSGGILRVGPKSAGAEPGPVCYGRGGTEPTVTDADLILGYLDPEFFYGGEMKLDKAGAERVLQSRIADALKLDLVAAASGIYRVVNTNMAAALGVVSVQEGFDPREFALVVAGGAGPIHAAAIARELEIPFILIPRESAVFCAAGMLVSDLKHDYVRTYAVPFDALDHAHAETLFQQMEDAARQTLVTEGISEDRIHMARSSDLRYIGQFHEVEVPVAMNGGGKLTQAALDEMLAAFHKSHDKLYGYSLPGAPVEVINLRVTAEGIAEKLRLGRRAAAAGNLEGARKGERDAYFANAGDFMRTPVYDGTALNPGHLAVGPAIIELPNTTIVVPPDFDLTCDEYGNYVMTLKGQDVSAVAAKIGRSLR